MGWSEFPYLRISFAFIFGIFITEYFELISPFIGWTCLIMSLIYFVCQYFEVFKLQKSYLYGLGMLIIIAFFGSYTLSYHKINSLNRVEQTIEKQELYFEAEILEELKSKAKIKYLVKLQQLKKPETNEYSMPIKSFVVFDSSDLIAKDYISGQTFIGYGSLKRIQTSKNPESFDYASFLKYKDIYFQVFLKEDKHCLSRSENDSWFYGLALNAKEFTSSTLKKYLSEFDQLGIAEALLTGQKSLISEDVYYNFTNTGAIHVLSVSGLHVMIFMTFFIWLFDRVKSRKIHWIATKIFSLIAIVWFYVIFTGMSPSVIRAGFMVSVYILGKNLTKSTNSFNILAITALSMLIYNPYFLFQASFQFSFLSLLSILYFQPKVKDWYIATNKVSKFCWSLINVSIAAQILVFPLTIFYFHKFPVYFMISGLVAVPIVSFIIYLGSIILVVEAIFSPLNEYLTIGFSFLLKTLNQSISYISHLPFSNIDSIWLSKLGLLCLGLGMLSLIYYLETKSRNSFYSILGIIFLTILENRSNKIILNNEKDLIVYDIHQATLIDVIESGTLKTYQSSGISEKSITFTAGNNRIKYSAHKIDSLSSLMPTRLFLFDQKPIYVYNSKQDFNNLKHNINIEVLVISKEWGNTPENVLSKLKPNWVILDKTVPPWISKKWTNYSKTSSWKLHQIRNDGAFQYSKNK